MTARQLSAFIVCALMMVIGRPATAVSSTNLLPGLRFFDGPENLAGSLVFLHEHDFRHITNNTLTSATIYQLDLQGKKLKKITEAPAGTFVPSSDGNLFAVIFYFGEWQPNSKTNLFAFSQTLGRAQTATMKKDSQATRVIGHHVFFSPDDNSISGRQIIDYDFKKSEQSIIELPRASTRQSQDYSMTFDPDATNQLQFAYRVGGARKKDGIDYETGFYDFDLETRMFVRSKRQERPDWIYRAFDGNYVFFEGDSPIEGTRLVSSPWNHRQIEFNDPKRKSVRLLKAFSKLSFFRGGTYSLEGLSPDRRFAFVKLDLPASRKVGPTSDGLLASAEGGSKETYYLIDVSTGKTRVLLENNVVEKSASNLSQIWWIPGSFAKR